MNIKSNVLKSVFAAGLALTGVAAISLGTNGQADAATVGESVTVDYNDGQSIAIWSNYHTATVTGAAKDGSTWTVLNTAKDASGAKWYKIGDRKWILAKYTTDANGTSASASTTSSYNNTNTNTNSSAYSSNNSAASKNYGYSYSYSNNTTSSNYSSNTSSTASTGYSYSASSAATTSSSTSTSSTTSSSSSEEAAKAWIANKESGSSYTASNGNYYGKYQLSLSYLNGDTSAANQEKVANSYVLSRYGSWTAAKAFWLANGWY
ncbi:aggregation promoting factor [Lactobacillus sp.]|uniref:aggregation-promoting factor n=1 Tax=Lactobacillus sp. TaxID=1591 RepID=UPI003EF099CA